MNKDEVDIFKSERQELFKTIFSYADSAIKNAMLINGGAAVAVLAFIGNVVTKLPVATPSQISVQSMVDKLSAPLLSFVLGVFFAALASGAAYVTQFSYYHDEKPQTGHVFRWIAISSILMSYIGFIVASFLCYHAFKHFS